MLRIPPKVLVPLCLALNGFSSVAIVFTNKVIFDFYDFKWSTTLTMIHFFVTFAGLLLCLALGMFEFKRIDIVRVLPLCASFCGFVVLTNMSLAYNSVGFYQLMKVLTTPLLIVLETFFYHKTFSTRIKLSLALICLGVTIATVTDSEVNMKGTIIALSALLITCQYQIWVGTKQKEFDCNSFQLLLYQAPISAIMLMPIAYYTEIVYIFMPITETNLVILFSGVIAFLVNISIFLVIGKTSPITYNVLGHFKLCVILAMGYLIFGNTMTIKNTTGVLLTLAGVFWYTHIKTSEAPRKVENEYNSKEELEKEKEVV